MMRRAATGLTLIEVLTVIAIMGVLLALAIPSFSEANIRKRIEGVAGELHTDLQFAKSQAASVNQDVWLESTAHGYSIKSSATTYKEVSTDSKVSLTDAVKVTFKPALSFPTAAASFDITHTGSSASLRVKVDALGRVQTCSVVGGAAMGYATCS